MSSLQVSVCIPVLNEEKNLAQCLSALSEFDDIVVVDSGSQDGTPHMAQAAGAKVINFRWDGRFPKKRNWALRNYPFKHPWVLFLDADERITTAFVEELRKVLPSTHHSGFWISFTNWFMGRPLIYGDVFRKLALFRRDAGEYEKFPEDHWSLLDMEVHEHPVIAGTVGSLYSRIEHHDHRGLSSWLARHNEYSTWEARRFLWLAEAGAEGWATLTPRQRFKYRHLNHWWFGWLYWFICLGPKLGLLDGRAGWTLARLKRRYFDEIRLKILELRTF